MKNTREIPKSIIEDLYFTNKLFWFGALFSVIGLALIIFLPWNIFLFLFLMLFISIGAFNLIREIRNIKLIISLLENGKITKGYVRNHEIVNTYISRVNLVRYFFDYNLNDGTTIKTSFIAGEFWRSINYKGELILFDLNKPENAVIIDLLNDSVKKWISKHISN
ncbi:MAG: hypothetical protein U0V72_02065 [Cytophagales bacterium]